MATTPPPPSPSKLRVPPAPRHGPKYDSWEPYATRHSARLAGQRASRDSHTTPPPSSPELRGQAGRMDERKQRGMDIGTLSPPGSTFTSPRKKTSGRTRGVLPTYSLDNTELDSSNPFDSQTTHARQHSFESSRTTITNGMLPTPMKTPRKKAVEDMSSAARTLFPTASASARPKKSKKYSGFSLESFEEEPAEAQGKIEIFTDSRDRIPQLDESEENPFYKKSAAPATITAPAAPRTSSRRKANGSKRDKEVADAIDREDGMTYVFRGKKVFHKFDEDVNMESGDDDDDDDLGLLAARPDLIDASLTSVRPLTRSSIEPRVLFPTAQKTGPDAVEEEEATDVEDNTANETEVDAGNEETQANAKKDPVTPEIRSTATTPASPGATIRSLRSRSKHIHDSTPTASGSKKEKRVSPFNGWMRKKQTPAALASASKKREADPVASIGGPATKKTKGK